MDKKIFATRAHLDDGTAMIKFLSPIPNGDRLGKLVAGREALTSRAYDDETQTARFIVSDGTAVACFTVVDVTIDQAEMIAAQCEITHAMSEEAFRDAVELALGTAFDGLN